MPRFGHVAGADSASDSVGDLAIRIGRPIWVGMFFPIGKQERGISMSSDGASSGPVLGRGLRGASALTAGFALILGAWVWSIASPDRLLERSYARVAPQGTLFLDDAGSEGRPHLPVTPARITSGATALLGAPAADSEVAPSGILAEPLSVGDRVQLAAVDAAMRSIEVQEVTDVSAPVVGMPGVRLQLVTARALDGRRTEPLRLIFAVREASPVKVVPVVVPATDKVL